MTRRARRMTFAISAVIVALLALTPFLIPVNHFRPVVEERASAALGRQVGLGKLRLSLARAAISTEALVIADDPAFSSTPFFEAKSVSVGVELMPLILSRSLEVTTITVDSPQVTLIRNSAGRWNYSSLGSSSTSSGDLAFKKLEWKNGRVIVGSTTSKQRSVYSHVDVAASDASLTTMFPLSASGDLDGGGHFTLAGNVGPLNREDASLTPLDGTLHINGLNLAARGFLNPSIGLGGVVDVDATIASSGDERDIRGTARISKALLVAGGSPSAQPVTVDFNTKYNRRKASGVLAPSTVKIGNATARLNGTYRSSGGDYSVVNIKVVGNRMPVTDLRPFLPGIGIHLPRGTSLAAGTLSADLRVSGPTNGLVTAGNVGLYGVKLAGFNLGAQVNAISGFSGLETGNDLNIERLTTNLRVTQNGLRFDTFNAVVPAVGDLIGAGTIDARNNLDFKMVANVTAPLQGGLGSMVGTSGAIGGAVGSVIGAITGGGTSGRKSKSQRIPFLVEGTTSDPRFVADVSGSVIPALMHQLGNLKGSDPAPGQHDRSSKPLGAIKDLFKKTR